MDLLLTPEQRAVSDLAQRIFAESAGLREISEVRELLASSGLDALFGGTEPPNRLLQTLIAEQAGGAVLDCNLGGLVVGASLQPGSVAAVLPGPGRWARFPADLDLVAVGTADAVTLHRIRAIETIQHRWGDPFGEIALGEAIETVDAGFLSWYRCVIAAEGVGAASKALELTWRYVTDRQQFGARLVDRQIVRHRLGELEMELNAARLIVYEAAWLAPNAYQAAMAAAAVSALSCRLVPALHRLTGAIGLTVEYPLARYTGRLRSVARELGSPSQLFREAARFRRSLIASSSTR
jgi:hypothetical protein